LQELEASPVHKGHAEDLIALTEELDHERRQLGEDREALTRQVRDMEVQISRERAELARQRSELQRMQEEIRHELEVATRDSALRDRLQSLMRRRHGQAIRANELAPALSLAADQSTATSPQPSRKDNGFFGRLFSSRAE